MSQWPWCWGRQSRQDRQCRGLYHRWSTSQSCKQTERQLWWDTRSPRGTRCTGSRPPESTSRLCRPQEQKTRQDTRAQQGTKCRRTGPGLSDRSRQSKQCKNWHPKRSTSPRGKSPDRCQRNTGSRLDRCSSFQGQCRWQIVPEGQAVHDVAPPAEHCPVLHTTGGFCALEQEWPAGQRRCSQTAPPMPSGPRGVHNHGMGCLEGERWAQMSSRRRGLVHQRSLRCEDVLITGCRLWPSFDTQKKTPVARHDQSRWRSGGQPWPPVRPRGGGIYSAQVLVHETGRVGGRPTWKQGRVRSRMEGGRE